MGSGSYGRVILAKDKYEGQYHAIKVLEKAKVVKKNQVEHTRNELSLLSSLSYDFIVNMRSYFKDNSNIFFVLDVWPMPCLELSFALSTLQCVHYDTTIGSH